MFTVTLKHVHKCCLQVKIKNNNNNNDNENVERVRGISLTKFEGIIVQTTWETLLRQHF